MRRGNAVEWLLLFISIIAAAITAAVYFYWFRDAPHGGPSEWSDFGDYFSGLLNPIIGIITVILVVLTLRTTRREAADTRRQMDMQIEHLKRQAVLNDMQKRLDGVLAEWNRMLDQRAPRDFQSIYASGSSTSITHRTVREIVESNERRSNLIEKSVEAHSKGKSFFPEEWKEFKHDLVPLLCELDRYCVEYERESGSHHLTAFYKARVHQGLRALHIAGTMPTAAAKRLLGEPLS